jgi:hypothetical protein
MNAGAIIIVYLVGMFVFLAALILGINNPNK